ncbi:MAG: dihydroneopterin aldolase [Holosporaceae bacterium]|jgi:dihydroneopterin aldolase|nr:dihydroneopterin aldolase [Holosporaceae bacterium]
MIRQLNVGSYKAFLILGNNEAEKSVKRSVIINISLRFLDEVVACGNDEIADAVCYFDLIKFIDNKLENKKFNLLERAVQFLYDEISGYLSNNNILKRIEIIKINPPVKNLGKASFICSDW